jgi:hypothetical protein
MRVFRHSWEEFVPPTERCVYCGLLKFKELNPRWGSNKYPHVPKYFALYRTEVNGELKEGRRATEFHCNSNRKDMT